METSERFSDNSTVCFAAMMLAMANAIKGDSSRSIQYGELAAEKTVTPADGIWASGFYGFALCRAGQTDRAIQLLERVVDAQQAAGFLGGEFFRLWLGEAYLAARDLARARQTLSQAVELWETHGMQFFIGVGKRLLGEIAVEASERYHEAESYFTSALSTLERLGAAPETALTYVGLGRLRKRQGNTDEARRCFERAHSIFEQLGSLSTPECLRAEMGRIAGT